MRSARRAYHAREYRQTEAVFHSPGGDGYDRVAINSLGLLFMPYFPVFMNLEGRPVLVVGGGKVAARKVRALLRCGAEVTVIAAALGEELETRRARDEIQWVAREFSAGMIDEYWLAFAATNDGAVNRAVFEAGEAHAIPVNVVDNRELCRFISPAVIDRDPVQVAVSTGGSSPMLARGIREWIESLLPHGLGKIALAAGKVRREFARRPPVDVSRRRWAFLMDRAWMVRWSTKSERAIERAVRAQSRLQPTPHGPGKVYLVGAGPGRPDLLTVRAVEVLQQADLILHDRLVPESILERARRDAERVDVGKRAGDHHGVQERIFSLMVDGARAGKTVVRLKGGDAFVFGRGGEELQHLRKHGIEYEVVPGITAALGCAAYAGIPLTHRDHAQRLTIATGHRAIHAHGSVAVAADLDRAADVQPGGEGETLVVYMGVKQARRVRAALLEKGVPASTPAALIIDGTMERQRVHHGTLAGLPVMAAQVESGAPGLFIIGAVAALGQDLAWFSGAQALEEAA